MSTGLDDTFGNDSSSATGFGDDSSSGDSSSGDISSSSAGDIISSTVIELLLNFSSSSSSSTAQNVTLDLPTDESACEAADMTIAIIVGIFSLITAGLTPKWFRDKPASAFISIAPWPFYVVVLNHAWIQYIQVYVDKLQLVDLSGYVRYIPPAVGFILVAPGNDRTLGRFILTALSVGGLVWLSTSNTDLSSSALPFTISAVAVALLMLTVPFIKQFVLSTIISVIQLAAWVILVPMTYLTPDAKTCGHPRNAFILCTPHCGTITTNYSNSAGALGLGITAGLVSWALGSCYVYRSTQSEKKKKRAREANAENGANNPSARIAAAVPEAPAAIDLEIPLPRGGGGGSGRISSNAVGGQYSPVDTYEDES